MRALFIEYVDVSDMVFDLSFTFPIGCNVKKIVEDLIIMNNIKHTKEQFDEALKLIEIFLDKYNQV